MYDIVICLQFWLETEGLNWKLLNDEDFQQVRFTLDNVIRNVLQTGLVVKFVKQRS